MKADGDGDFGAAAPHEEAVTLHGPPMIRGNRMYCAWWGGGISVIDCSDLRNMKLVGHLSWAPPFPGSNHTCWPLGDRPYLICTDEARAKQKYWDAQFMWVIDARKEDKLMPIATFMPDREKYFNRPGRYGAHNILEHLPADGPWKDIVFLTYFNAGLARGERQRSVPSEGDRLLRAGAGRRPAGGAVQRHRHRRARPALSDRPRRRGHAYSGVHGLEPRTALFTLAWRGSHAERQRGAGGELHRWSKVTRCFARDPRPGDGAEFTAT